MNGDYQLEDTVYLPFTTRAFGTGIPTALVSGEVQIYEDANVTQITGAETLTVSLDSIPGFNMCQVDMTAANGFESGRSYTLILSAGTVGGVSVVGEVVGHFTMEMSAAALDLANVTDGLGALSTSIAGVQTTADSVETDTQDIQTQVGTAGAGLTDLGGMSVGMKAEVKVQSDTSLVDVNLDHLVGTAAPGIAPAGTYLDIIADDGTATYDRTTDSLQAIRDRGDAAWTTGAGGSNPYVLQNTTIATLATQVSFTLTAGSADDDAYNGMLAIVEDVATATQKAVGVISDYTGATKTVTLREDPGVFTMAATDTIDIVVVSPDILDILADTADIQANYATSTALATVDTVVDAIKAVTDVIPDSGAMTSIATAAALTTVDTVVDGIQTDLSNGTDGLGAIKADTAAILVDTADIQPNYATSASIAALNDVAATDIVSAGAITTSAGAVSNVTLVATTTTNTDAITVADILTTAMTEAYNTDGVAPTLAEALHLIIAYLTERSVTGTTVTAKKLDGSTTAATFTLDDGTNPTSVTRAT